MKSFAVAALLGSIQAHEEMDIFEHTGITPAERDTLFNPTEYGPEPTDPCCHDCSEPLEKYHSVDHIFNNCGEACMDPSKFWLYKLFEPGLEKSDTNTPCADRQYTDYQNTPTHGFGPVKMTLDLYAPTKTLKDDQSYCEGLKSLSPCDADDKCSWCVSAAVASKCNSLETAKALPSAVFQCDKISMFKGPQETCEALGDADSCDANDQCSWCKSAAVKSACKDLDTAKSLPSAVFQCDKLEEDLQDDDEHCEQYSAAGACDGDDICSWCVSAAVKPSCKSMTTAKALPASVFACDKLSEDAVFLN